jgi:CelD/BcsL family acetyltransferase involved in cellulose biosynthesis
MFTAFAHGTESGCRSLIHTPLEDIVTLHYRLARAAQLTSAEFSLWDEIQRSHADFESPYFRPEFFQAVARVRDDVECIVVEQQGQPVGFLPFQRSSLNIAKPLAGKLSDFHGVLAAPGTHVDVPRLLQAMRVAAFDFDFLIGDQPAFAPYCRETKSSGFIDLAEGFQAYCGQRKKSGSEVIRKTISKQRKLEREVGPLRFELRATDPAAALEQVIAWKVDQFARTGFMNPFAYPWTKQLLVELIKGDARCGAMVSVLWCGERPVAIHCNLRSHDVLHLWFIGYDTSFAAYSPGMVMLLKVLEAAAANGVRRVHFGAGDQQFKTSFSTGALNVYAGSVERTTPGVLLRRAWRWSRSAAASNRVLQTCSVPVAAALKPVRSWLAFK